MVTLGNSSWLSLLAEPGAKQGKVRVEVGLGILEVLFGGATRISCLSRLRVTASSLALFLDNTTQKIHQFLVLTCEGATQFQACACKEKYVAVHDLINFHFL